MSSFSILATTKVSLIQHLLDTLLLITLVKPVNMFFSKLAFALSTFIGLAAIQGSYGQPTGAVAAVAAVPPAPPGLSFLYSLNCTLGTQIPVGTGPRGTRIVIPIVGGTFQGPKLKGRLALDYCPASLHFTSIHFTPRPHN